MLEKLHLYSTNPHELIHFENSGTNKQSLKICFFCDKEVNFDAKIVKIINFVFLIFEDENYNYSLHNITNG